jgi:glycosyltransferase involved in cell wall biosynthesis
MRLLKRLRPDVIYENGGCAYTGIAAFYAKKTGCKMIWHIASDNDLKSIYDRVNLKPHKFIEKQILQWGVRNAMVVIAQSEYQKQIVARYNKKAIIHLIRNFHPIPDRKEMSDKLNQIVWVANFKQLKQPELYIQLASALSARNIDVQCIMIGSPTTYPKGYQSTLYGKINRVNNLKYLGKLSQDKINKIIAQSKLFINTSKWEGFPNTFIQAWFRKTPVVSLHCDPDNVIRDFKCGKVSGTIDRMFDDVFMLLNNEKLRTSMGENAHRYAMQYHSLDNLKRLENVIHDQ